MSNKRPYAHVKSTATTIDLIIDRVMLYLQAEGAFLVMDANEETIEFFRREVRSAVTTVLNDRAIIFSLDVGDVNDKLDRLVDDWDREEWPPARKIAVLEALWRNENMAEALDHWLEWEVMHEAGLLGD